MKTFIRSLLGNKAIIINLDNNSTEVLNHKIQVKLWKNIKLTILTCLLPASGSLSPRDKMGIIEGNTLSPSFLTSSPSALPAT